MGSTPSVSVVVATRNRQALLATTLEALCRQDWPCDQFEIVVADNGSTDATSAVVRQAAERFASCRIRYIFVPERGKSYAVNAAIEAAAGDVLAFTDDDVRPEAAWLTHLVSAFVDPRIDFAAGRTLPAFETAPPAWLSPALYGVLAIADGGVDRRRIVDERSTEIMPIGANMAVRTAVMRRIGGLRTDLGKLEGTLRTGEDHELFLRLLADGRVGSYEPLARVHHWVPAQRMTLSYFRRWLFQNGQDVARLERAFESRRRRLLGIPRFLWRDAALCTPAIVAGLLRGSLSSVVAGLLRLVWFAGYFSCAWFRRGTRAHSPRVRRVRVLERAARAS